MAACCWDGREEDAAHRKAQSRCWLIKFMGRASRARPARENVARLSSQPVIRRDWPTGGDEDDAENQSGGPGPSDFGDRNAGHFVGRVLRCVLALPRGWQGI